MPIARVHKRLASVTFSDSNSAPVPGFSNRGPEIFQIWKSDSCSDSGYNHQSNRDLPMFLLKKWPHTWAGRHFTGGRKNLPWK